MSFQMNRHNFFVLSVWNQTETAHLAKDSHDGNLSGPHKDVCLQNNNPSWVKGTVLSLRRDAQASLCAQI